jgi:alanine dehydrogenase
VLAIVGAGVQGEHHLRTFPLTRDFDEIRISSAILDDAERLAATHPRARAVGTARDAVRGADVVALATHAAGPVIEPGWIAPGTHVSSVGYRPPAGELPLGLLHAGGLFVETREAFAPTPVGCAELAGLDPAAATELGEVLLGLRPGRTASEQITVYKAMGHVAEDIAAAELVYAAARREGAGVMVEL